MCLASGVSAQSPTSRGNVPAEHLRAQVEHLDRMWLDSRGKSPQWFLAEYDFDNRGYNVLHFMGFSPLPHGFSIWGFIDIEGADLQGSDRAELSRYFLEIDLKKQVWKNAGLVAELNDLQGVGNEIGRVGAYWQPDTSWLSIEQGPLAGPFKLGFKCFPVETDGQGGQLSFNWNKRFDNVLGGRLSAGGFFDWNYGIGPRNEIRIVTEHQIRWRLMGGLHLITEFRQNDFLADNFGIAPGIQYRF